MTRDTTPRSTTGASLALAAVLAVGVAGLALAGGVAAQNGGDANFQVTIDSTNSPVLEGDPLEVTATVENTGGSSGTQTVALDVGGSQQDSTSMSLAPGESTTRTFVWNTGDGDDGRYTASVSSDNDTAETDVRVQSPANFQVFINETNSPITENDTLTVEVNVENRGDRTDNQEITLEANGEEQDSVNVALDGGADQTRTLEWDTSDDDDVEAGDYTVTVASEDDSDSAEITINDVADFEVEIDSTNEPVVEGDTLEVEATIRNTDNTGDEQEIDLLVGGNVRDTETVQLDEDDDETIVLTWDTDRGDAGNYVANVTSDTDSATTDVSVNAPPTVTFTRDPTTPDVDESVTFDAEDATDPDGTIVEYEWTIDGETVSTAESFSYTFTEAGAHEVSLSVTDDEGATRSTSRTISVNALPEVSIPDVEATVGEEVSIQADASDDGSISKYEWAVDGQVVSTQETLTYTFESAGTHQVTLRVTDDDGATTATTKAISVGGGATPTPTSSATASPTNEDQPGFGAAIAVVALLATALLARRRS